MSAPSVKPPVNPTAPQSPLTAPDAGPLPRQQVQISGTEGLDHFSRRPVAAPDAGMKRGFGRSYTDPGLSIRTVASVGTFPLNGFFERLAENGFDRDIAGQNQAYFG